MVQNPRAYVGSSQALPTRKAAYSRCYSELLRLRKHHSEQFSAIQEWMRALDYQAFDRSIDAVKKWNPLERGSEYAPFFASGWGFVAGPAVESGHLRWRRRLDDQKKEIVQRGC